MRRLLAALAAALLLGLAAGTVAAFQAPVYGAAVTADAAQTAAEAMPSGGGTSTTVPNTAAATGPVARPPTTLMLAALGTGLLILISGRLQRPVTVQRRRDWYR